MLVARVAVAALAVSACAIPEEELQTTEATQAVGGAWGGGGDDCEDWGCGQNSPEVDQLGSHEWRVDFQPNPQGFRIAKVSHPSYFNVLYQLSVASSYIVATPIGGGTTLHGTSLVGLIIHVEHAERGLNYLIRVNGFTRGTRFFADTNHGDATNYRSPSYVLEWNFDADQPPNPIGGTPWKNICKAPVAGSADNLGMAESHVVVFEGDRIDAASKTVTGYDPAYFNIGCAGHALAKMHLSGHTEAAKRISGGAFNTTITQRTTILKMFSADYCGYGKAFTRAGEPLQWRDRNGWMLYDPPTAYHTMQLEARWDQDGVTCLETPRLSTSTYPRLMDDITEECGGVRPPLCRTTESTNPNYFYTKHIVSANPVCTSWQCATSTFP